MTQLGTLLRRHFEPLLLSIQVVVDLAVVLFSCWLGFAVGEHLVGGSWTKAPPREVFVQLWSLTAAICLVAFHAFGMYSPRKSLLNVEEYKAIAKSTVVAFFVLFTMIVFLRTSTSGAREQDGTGFVWLLRKVHDLVGIGDSRLNPDAFPRSAALLSFAFILVLMTASRFLSFKLIQSLHRRGIGNRNVLIYGTGEIARWLQRKFLLVPTLGLRLVGYASEDPDDVGRRIDRSLVLGTYDDLPELVRLHKLHEVFIALPEADEQRLLELIQRVEELGASFRVVPRFYHLMSQNVRIENMDSIPLITRPVRRERIVTGFLKRLLDISIALATLILTAPLFVAAAILIKRDSRGPVFFRQVRIGRGGKPFPMFKFRTMYVDASGDAVKPADAADPRITRIGRHLRRYSLDELPQFFNVLRGEMSVVGPRPEMPFLVEQYGPFERERLRAKPGITGLWQISYHRQEAIHANLDYDVYYVENQSLLLDLVIMCLTVVAVVKGTGAH